MTDTDAQGVKYTELLGEGRLGEKAEWLEYAASLRGRLFAGYPYFYDPELDPEYESEYLNGLSENPLSHVVVAWNEGQVVGAATALPLMSDAEILEGVEPSFRAAGFDPESFFYYSEVLVDPAHRRRGIAAEFYRRRRAAALQLGYPWVCFAAIDTESISVPPPANYFDPAPLWHSLGFERRPDLATRYAWPTRQPDGPSTVASHPMIFWVHRLTASPTPR
jgi:GNAT superfamily N-acetyltransferase